MIVIMYIRMVKYVFNRLLQKVGHGWNNVCNVETIGWTIVFTPVIIMVTGDYWTWFIAASWCKTAVSVAHQLKRIVTKNRYSYSNKSQHWTSFMVSFIGLIHVKNYQEFTPFMGTYKNNITTIIRVNTYLLTILIE